MAGGRRVKRELITDYPTLLKMINNPNEREVAIAIVRDLAKRANTRISTLEKAGYTNEYALGKAKLYNEKQGRKNFYRGSKFDSIADLKALAMNVTYFLNAESSTLKGIKAINQRRYDTFAKNHGLIRIIQTKTGQTREEVIQEHKDAFYEFLKSNQFKDMRKRIASDQLLDDFALALMQGYSLEEIQEQYLEEHATEKTLTIDKIAEKYNRAKWQLEKTNGGLLGRKR